MTTRWLLGLRGRPDLRLKWWEIAADVASGRPGAIERGMEQFRRESPVRQTETDSNT